MAHLSLGDFKGDANIGLFGVATDKFVFLPDDSVNSEVLNVPRIFGTVCGTKLLGIFCVGNSNTLLVPQNIMDKEFETIKEQLEKIDSKISLVRLDTKHNVLGNLILANDSGAVISPVLEDKKEEISSLLKVPVVVSNIMDFEIVGSVCTTTNKGFLLNIYAEESDYEFVKKALKVDGDIGSVNLGGPFVSSGILANSNGVIVGKNTTGPETARIDEALGFI
ncbi:MAG: translation initiation factor IF-6 [Candidatus Aenigmarchaeota archaeon]|nr:translation initiation factor IF-6 [Candidatus Aenigmarchaeota archaeon]